MPKILKDPDSFYLKFPFMATQLRIAQLFLSLKELFRHLSHLV